MTLLQRSFRILVVMLFGLPAALGAHLLPTVGGAAWGQGGQEGCTWDGDTLTCPLQGMSPDEWCAQYGNDTTAMCEGDFFVGPRTSVVYVDAKGDGGAGTSNDTDDGDTDDGAGNGDNGDANTLQFGPATEAECVEVGGTWKSQLYCDMPMDEHISADCACYWNGDWVNFGEKSYPHCMAVWSSFHGQDPTIVCQWPFP